MDKITNHMICELTSYKPVTMSVSQGDRMAREISCRLLENGGPWPVPEDSRVVVAYTLPDGTTGSYDTMPDGTPAWAVAGNIITVALIDPLTILPGPAELSIVLLGSEGQQLAVWPVRLWVVGDKKMTVPENLPPLGAGYAGRILYGGPGGLLTPLGLGDGIQVERREDGSCWLVAEGGGYYSPVIISNEADNSFTITFEASKADMPAVAPITIKLPETSNDSGDNGFDTDETLSLKDGILSVNTTNAVQQDNNQPITSGAVYDEFSRAVALLKTI